MIPVFLFFFLGTVLVSTDGGVPAEGTSASPQTASQASDAVEESAAIGTVSELSGDVRAAAADGTERALTQGDAVFQGDTVTAGEKGSAQIEFLDGSLFTISAKTSVRLDQFIFSEETGDGSFAAYVAKGIFRFITGKIAEKKPENVEVEVPSGTVGIRGTIIVGEIDGENCLVSLEAEEGKEAVPHRIIVSSRVDGQMREVEITRPGYATRIEARGQMPAPIFRLPEETQGRFKEQLRQPHFLPRGEDGRAQHNPRVGMPGGRGPGSATPASGKDQQQKGFPGGPPPGGSGPGGPGGNANGPSVPGGFQKQPGQPMPDSRLFSQNPGIPQEPPAVQKQPAFGELRPVSGGAPANGFGKPQLPAGQQTPAGGPVNPAPGKPGPALQNPAGPGNNFPQGGAAGPKNPPQAAGGNPGNALKKNGS